MIRKGETGKDIVVITSFDMSSASSLTIKAVPPSGNENVKTWTASLGQALADVTLEDGSVVDVVPVNQSMKYTLSSHTDLDEEGEWTIVGIYENTNSDPDDYFISDPVVLTVESDNFS